MNRLKLIITALVLTSSIAATATPIYVSTSVGNYEVDLLEGFTADVALELEEQVWFGDAALATEFAELIFDEFGAVNDFSLYGPYFVHTLDYTLSRFSARFWLPESNSIANISSPFSNSVYAVATAVPEPATLLLLCAGLAGLRLQRQKNVGATNDRK